MGDAMRDPQSTLGTVIYPATDRRLTGEAGRPVKCASRVSLLDLRAAGFSRLPASFQNKFKRAARGAVSRLINRPVSGDQKTGAGLPARAAFYCIRMGASSHHAASCAAAHLLPRSSAASNSGRAA
ncbi:hypothetical protein GCM10010873_26810 [Cypionkella aquatica]|uniref:Uncharacterized protein n=1 Tax=Cypionkella aquatica TaxID=1756042 RepID=A0AA37X100_9RHOB|nr:hypothetical protein GCM10010873_26810 [Cypionkella aquatica]